MNTNNLYGRLGLNWHLRSFQKLCLLSAIASGLSLTFSAKADGHRTEPGSGKAEVMQAATKSPSRDRKSPKLPPLPAGVTELKFNEFFKTPVGPRGLELSEKLKDLEGKRVRILGYMVRQEHGTPGSFILSPLPVEIHEHDNAMADDLPAAVIYVSSPTHAGKEVPFAPGLMLLTGTLSIGATEEANGRISLVRLTMDPVPRRYSARSSTFDKGGQNLLKNQAAFPRRESR